MLNQLRSELPEGCISDLTFDEWRAGELAPERIEVLEAHLEGCERCQTRHDAIEAEAERFLERFPMPDLSPKTASKVVSLERSRARWLGWASSGLAAAAAVLLFVASHRDRLDSHPTETRKKGASSIGFFVKHGESVRAGSDGQVVHPGDQLRFSITSTRAQHVAILSLDGARVASIYYPTKPTSQGVGVVQKQLVDSSVLLDDTLGEEKLLGIFCDQPFELEPLKVVLARDGKLPSLPGCSVDELSIVKAAEP